MHFSTTINVVVSTLLVCVLLIFRKFILGIFGADFLIGETALIILCLGQLVNSVCGPVGSVLQMTGHQKAFQNILLGALVVNLALNFLLIGPLGMNGVAIATAAGLVFWNLVSTLYIRKKLGISVIRIPFGKSKTE